MYSVFKSFGSTVLSRYAMANLDNGGAADDSEYDWGGSPGSSPPPCSTEMPSMEVQLENLSYRMSCSGGGDWWKNSTLYNASPLHLCQKLFY